jgi:hypothetical protein
MSTAHRRSALLAAVLLIPVLAEAQAPAPAAPRTGPLLRPVVELAIEAGGDRVAEVLSTNGDRQSVRAGQGGTLAAGLEFRPSAASPFALRGTVGYKVQTTAAENVDISLTRIPVEVVGSYEWPEEWRIGAGLTHHASVKFNGGDLAPDASLGSATGGILEVGWKWVAVPYTAMPYTPEGLDIDANAIGLSFAWAFGKR